MVIATIILCITARDFMLKLLKNLLLFCFVVIVCSRCSDIEPIVPDKEYQAGLQLESLTWEGRSRTYQVYFPLETFASESLPILFVLHGGGGNATEIQFSTRRRFNELADMQGFIVVYPEGVENRWNDGRASEGVATTWDEDIDDVGFITEIIRLLEQDYRIDESKIFTSGISNGGFMSSRLLCEKSDVFKAGAILTATIPVSFLEACTSSNPNSLIVINGTADPLILFDGGPIEVFGQQT